MADKEWWEDCSLDKFAEMTTMKRQAAYYDALLKRARAQEARIKELEAQLADSERIKDQYKGLEFKGKRYGPKEWD